ncbi:HEAT repeat domain-containing protein [Calothrix sp. NIES-2098]|uniref:HEAT repeat domain-containing protein n=1 Tax=Calothrix sp. NIES-2098 TaxID=1954171 RepID=UPI000B5DDE42|nr:hypothetical protein NIES2098_50720 [Calothrix sp. NIES-2098]
MVNWTGYLESLCNDEKYVKCWNAYTLTDVIGHQRVEQERSLLLLDFMVETVKPAKGEPNAAQEQTERLDVLAGLRKYAKEHVLLVGRPGSGKSTALARLLLEESQSRREMNFPANSESRLKTTESPTISPFQRTSAMRQGIHSLADSRIPVLVELRYYQTSILDLIRDFCKRHRLLLDTATIEQLLFAGDLLLLVDGINELPSEAARQDLYKFRQDYQKTTPMIFTTRDLGVGGDLGITKKLEMQPLTAEQMQQFVRAYLPEQGEQMLQQLGDRLREFGETPLLLMMLCSLFKATGDIPPNLGLVFRQFTQSYERQFRQDIPVTDESRRWWFSLLKHLAFHMTKGDKLTDLNVAIPRSEAEEVLTQFLKAEKFDRPRDRALQWLQDLLNHHLIQLGANEQIEFRHQLIQEYYTAECLLTQLPSFSDDCLKREYLNYLKWTEPLKLMLELVHDEAQALRVVKLALEVDWQLGARLAGAVKSEFQQQTVNLVAELEIPLLFKIHLLGLTKSEKANHLLIKLLEYENYDVRRSAASALGGIKSEQAIPELIKLLEYENYDVRRSAASALGEIKSQQAIPELIKLLEDEDSDVRKISASALGEIKSQQAIPELIKLLEDEDSDVRKISASALGKIKSEQAISKLIELLENEDFDVIINAAYALGKIESDVAILGLIKMLGSEKLDVQVNAALALRNIKSDIAVPELIKLLKCEKFMVQFNAAFVLGGIKSEQAIPGLIKLLEDEDSDVRKTAAFALNEIKSEQAIPGLIKLLKDEDSNVRSSAASALGGIKSEQVIPQLLKLLEDKDSNVRSSAASALGGIQSEQVISQLLKLLEDKDSNVRSSAASALGGIQSEQVIPQLLKLLEDKDSNVRSSAASALGGIQSEQVISQLLKLLEDKDSNVRSSAASALGGIQSEQVIPQLLKLLEDKDSNVRSSAASALARIQSEQVIPQLLKLLEDEDFNVYYFAASALKEIKSEVGIPLLMNLLKNEKFVAANNGSTLVHALQALEATQENCKYYNSFTQPITKAKPQLIKASLMYILHLSDLHFSTPNQAQLWSNQLASDLLNELNIPHLDTLILSGDIANYCTPEEYQIAEEFLAHLRQEFTLNPDQIIIVPGNHDLNWGHAKKAYQLIDRDEYDGELKEGEYIQESASVIRVRDEEKYKQRFTNFSNFYQAIKGKSYPLEYHQQYTLDYFPNQNLLILGLNSAWQLDHHYKSRASINMNALSNALSEIRRNQEYRNCIKIAVWHHPLDSAGDDSIKDQGFIEQLAVSGFRFFLHGHIHKAESSQYRYDLSTNGRKLDRICAGTFGAPVREWVPGYPLQYNLLKFEGDKLTVNTRRREELNGAWKPDARWLMGVGQNPLPYYEISLG